MALFIYKEEIAVTLSFAIKTIILGRKKSPFSLITLLFRENRLKRL